MKRWMNDAFELDQSDKQTEIKMQVTAKILGMK